MWIAVVLAIAAFLALAFRASGLLAWVAGASFGLPCAGASPAVTNPRVFLVRIIVLMSRPLSG